MATTSSSRSSASTLDRPVYDLDVEHTHNFIANGIVTHNSIYGFRGADITNILEFRGHVPRRPGGQAGAELPLDADDPRCGQRGDPQQPGPEAQVAVDRPGPGGSDQGPRARRRARRGAVRDRGDPAAGRRGHVAGRDRRLLPDQLAVAGARGHARAGRDRLPGDRRHEVLRAGRDQGRDRLPDRAGQPAGRRRVHADRQFAPARDRRRRRCRGVLAYANTTGETVWELAAAPEDGARARARRRSRRCGGSWARWRCSRERLESGRRDLGAAQGDAAGDRLSGGARGRAHDRGPGPDREPRGARQRGRRVRRRRRRARDRWRSSCSRSR